MMKMQVKTFFRRGRMNNYLFALVILLFLLDDVGTSIGFQANEKPADIFEANHGFCLFCEYMIINGYVTTHTSAFRLNALFNLLLLSTLQYFGLFGDFSTVWVLYLAVTKAMAGWPWWRMPNNYGILDFITFNPGRVTPHRMGLRALRLLNASQQGALTITKRRRLIEEAVTTKGSESYTQNDYLNLIFNTSWFTEK